MAGELTELASSLKLLSEQLQLTQAADCVVPRSQPASPAQGVVAVVGPVEQPGLAHSSEQLGLFGVVLDGGPHAEPASNLGLGAQGGVVHVVEGEPVGVEPCACDVGQVRGPGGDPDDVPPRLAQSGDAEAGALGGQGLGVQAGIAEGLV